MESEMSIAIEALLQTREKLFEATGLNISLAQREQKELYDRKHNPNELQDGTIVLNEYTPQKQRKGGKMDDRWLGPYPINRCIVYELKNMKGAVLMTKVNVNRLKVYKYPDEHKESNEDMDAKSEKNEGTDARSEENEGADAKSEENGRKGGSNKDNGKESASNEDNEGSDAKSEENV